MSSPVLSGSRGIIHSSCSVRSPSSRSFSVARGEQVAARFRYYPSDETLLCFEKDDILEVLEILADGKIKVSSSITLSLECLNLQACHSSNRKKMGIVLVEHVRKVRIPSSLSLDSPVSFSFSLFLEWTGKIVVETRHTCALVLSCSEAHDLGNGSNLFFEFSDNQPMFSAGVPTSSNRPRKSKGEHSPPEISHSICVRSSLLS